jgi:hypothetical protein
MANFANDLLNIIRRDLLRRATRAEKDDDVED